MKDTLNQYQKGKQRFKALSIEAELAARGNWAKCAERVEQSDRENDKLRTEVKSLSIVAVQSRDKAKDKERESQVWREKAERMEREGKKVKMRENRRSDHRLTINPTPFMCSLRSPALLAAHRRLRRRLLRRRRG